MLLNPIAPLKSSSIRNLAVHSHSTRRFNDLRLPRPCTNWGIQTFIDHAAWNSLPIGFKDINFLSMFPEAKTRKTKHLKLFCCTSQLKNRLRRNRLLYAGWLTHLPRFQLRSTTWSRRSRASWKFKLLFPMELVSFVCPRELEFWPSTRDTSLPIGKRIWGGRYNNTIWRLAAFDQLTDKTKLRFSPTRVLPNVNLKRLICHSGQLTTYYPGQNSLRHFSPFFMLKFYG